MRWAACAPLSETVALAGLRLFPGVQVAEAPGLFWLRGPNLDPELELALKKIPGLERFDIVANDRLRPIHSRIADRLLPSLNWRPVADAIAAALPPAALPGDFKQKLPVSLVRSAAERPAAALLTSFDPWRQFAAAAPLIRLEPLRFAVMDSGHVLVLGTPLPGLPGTRLAHCDGVLVPCGFTWTPAVDTEVLRQLFALHPGDAVLLATDHTAQLIRAEQFVSANRGAIRLTFEELPHA